MHYAKTTYQLAMKPEEAFKPIIDAIKAHPECKHIKCVIDKDWMYIIGKYGYISKLCTDRAGTIVGDMYVSHSNRQEEVCGYIKIIIRRIISETKPNDTHHSLKAFYEANFPCLAEELGYMTYKQEIEFGFTRHMQDSKPPIEVICPALYHWDLLAFERKVRAALDGSQLPLPIRNEIFSLFYID